MFGCFVLVFFCCVFLGVPLYVLFCLVFLLFSWVGFQKVLPFSKNVLFVSSVCSLGVFCLYFFPL